MLVVPYGAWRTGALNTNAPLASALTVENAELALSA